MRTLFNIKRAKIIILTLSGIILIGFLMFSRKHLPAPFATPPQYLLDHRANIIGTFIGENDPYWKLVFTSSGKCYWYNDGVLSSVNTYSISNTTPQCGMDVPIDESTESAYLSIVDDANGMTDCYSINGFTSTTLSIRRLGEGGVILLNKQ